DWHSLHHENPAFAFDAARLDERTWRWSPYREVPAVVVRTDAAYEHEPQWFRQCAYGEERARGLDFTEDLASPGTFTFELSAERRVFESLSSATRTRLTETCEALLTGYQRGTRFGIHMDGDGLLAAGVPGVALTWMDAVVHGEPVTPRIGKPVEVQALWINAL